MSVSEDQINQWLEEGLRHYGLGDPAKALDVWLQVLAAEPKNTRAKEYVEIVRSTYGDEAVADAQRAASTDAPVESAEASAQGAPEDLSTPQAVAIDATPETTPAQGEADAVATAPAVVEVAASSNVDSVASATPEPSPVPPGPRDDGAPEDTGPVTAASPLPVTNIDAADPLDSIEGPSWADVAADAESASAAFESSAFPTASVYKVKSDVSITAAEDSSKTSLQDDSAQSAPLAAESNTGAESGSGGVEAKTSGAAGPVEVEASGSDDEPSVKNEKAPATETSASVKIGSRPAPIEESVSNVVHSVRYGESFDDASSPKAGAFFTTLKEKAREDSEAHSRSEAQSVPNATESLELNRSEIIESVKPLPVPTLPTANDTVEIRAEDMAAIVQANAPAAPEAPPERPEPSPLVEALSEETPSAAATVELDRAKISVDARTVRIPSMDVSAEKGATIAGMSNELNESEASSLQPRAPETDTPLADPLSVTDDVAPEQDIFAPTPLADVPTTPPSDSPAANLFDDGPVPESAANQNGKTGENAPAESVSDAFRNAWGEEGAPTMDLDVDPAAPSMFDLLLSSSDKSNESKPMDVGVLRQKKKPEDGKRGASQDMAPLVSTPAFAVPAKTDAEPTPTDVSDEKHECDVLMDGAKELFGLGDFSGSLELVEKVLEIDADHAEAKNYFKQNASTLLKMYESKLGNLQDRPTQLTSPDEVIWMNMHHRAGFVLSQVDGGLTYEEIADVSGLPRLETFRILAELKQNGVIG